MRTITDITICTLILMIIAFGAGFAIGKSKLSEEKKETSAERIYRMNAQYICDNPKLARVIK